MLRAFQGYLIIVLVGLSMAVGVSVKYKQDMDSARRSYINEEHYKAAAVAKEIEVVFHTVYQGLRIITRLPGVRDIDRYGKNFTQVERQTAHEVYESIAEIISLSEIYIVPADFDPDKPDRETGHLQEPIVMFDDLIGEHKKENSAGTKVFPSLKTPKIQGDETYEYRLIVDQIKLFKENFPSEQSANESLKPVAVGGKEIITCDNSRYDSARPDDSARSGFVYSMPFYDKHGALKGVVSGIMLSAVLAEHLPNEHYVLGNAKHGYLASRRKPGSQDSSRRWYEKGDRDPRLVYSETIPLDIPDVFGGWYLWVGSPNGNFESNNDVVVARQFRFLGFMFCLILTLGATVGYYTVRTHNERLRQMNKKLVDQQGLLERSRSRIKKFSGKILSIREEEKKRLGRDLHDMVGSMAISLNARLSVLEANIRNSHSDRAVHDVHDFKKVLESIVQNFKKIVTSVRPVQLETVGLSTALREYCAEIGSLAGLKLEFYADIPDANIPEDLAIAIYRVVQEALTNIVKHAQAQRCSIKMFYDGGDLHLIIADDGVGMESHDIEFYSQKSKMGLLGIRERVESFGGVLKIVSRHGGGTEYNILIPLSVVEMRGAL